MTFNECVTANSPVAKLAKPLVAKLTTSPVAKLAKSFGQSRNAESPSAFR